MSYRPEWWPLTPDGADARLMDMCQMLHEDYTGSSDALGDTERSAYIQALEHARDNWKNPSSMYDDAVRRLVVRTLNERKPKVETPPDCIRVAVPRANPNNS